MIEYSLHIIICLFYDFAAEYDAYQNIVIEDSIKRNEIWSIRTYK